MPQGKSSFTWDSPSLRFRESSTGRFVAHRKVFQETQRVVQVSQQRMLKTTEQFARGEITLPDFKLAMMKDVKSLNIATAISANGGLAQMDARRWGEVGARLRREYGYLNELGTKIANGQLSAQSGRLRTSARAYAASSQTLFWELTNRRMKETGNFVLARRVMGVVGTEHCSGCSSEASKNFMPLDEIAPIGSKECKWFCHCSIEYRIQQIKWQPAMTREMADRWVSDSEYREPVFHATSIEDAPSLLREGFDLKRKVFGRAWGNGVYAGTDIETAKVYQRPVPGSRGTRPILEMRVKASKAYIFDVSNSPTVFEGTRAVARGIPGGDLRYKQLVQSLEQKNTDLRLRGYKLSASERKEFFQKNNYEDNVAAEALTILLQENGYDALIIKDFPGGSAVIGGNQIIVFDPKKVVIIKP